VSEHALRGGNKEDLVDRQRDERRMRREERNEWKNDFSATIDVIGGLHLIATPNM
jgi:hypothetical protein